MGGGLFEREAELGRIDALLAVARAGGGGVMVIIGPGGSWERALLGGGGGGGGPGGGGGWCVGGGGGRGRAGDAPCAGVHGMYWLTVNASEAARVLVAIDDLHWADQASLRFVLYLTARLAGLPVALAVTWRTGEAMAPGAADCLARLEQAAAGSVVFPGALSREAVHALLSETSGTPPGERFGAACHAVTGGNPFLVRELIQNLRAGGTDPGEAAVGREAGPGPRSVARSLALRLPGLGPRALDLAPPPALLGCRLAPPHPPPPP